MPSSIDPPGPSSTADVIAEPGPLPGERGVNVSGSYAASAACASFAAHPSAA
ncbi:hypothetical protein ABZ318_25800 [Streptomyces sp. NPDC006197]|uniref:hypothetical protein n=1 Tax=Streptomyces sp. NPDC006197 TaxID=3156685 RepID=UPI0033BD02A8